VAAAWPRFDTAGYARSVLGNGWASLELKQRTRRLSSTLHRFLPMPYARQVGVLEKAAPPFSGFEGMLFPDFDLTVPNGAPKPQESHRLPR
jgi:hypothetical protein